jgi:hypothetical protein
MPCGWVFAIRSRTPEASGPPLVSKEELVVLEKQFAGGFRKAWSFSQERTALKRPANDFPLAEALPLPCREFGRRNLQKLQLLSKSSRRVGENPLLDFCSTIFGEDNLAKIRRLEPS